GQSAAGSPDARSSQAAPRQVAAPALPPITRVPRTAPAAGPAASAAIAVALPTSYAQQRLWFLDRLAPDRATYNVAAAYRLASEPSPAALAAALGGVVRRHEA